MVPKRARCLVGVLVALCATVLLWNAEAPCGAIHIQIPGEARVKGDDVALGHIARISGDNQKIVNQLKDVILASAPEPGKSLTLRREDIINRITARPELSEGISWDLPETVAILSDQVVISKEKIGEWITEAIRSKMNRPEEQVQVHPVVVERDVLLPRGRVTHEIVFPPNGLNQKNIPIGIIFRVDGEFSRHITVNARVDFYQPVVIAARALAKGTIIGPDDIRSDMRAVQNFPYPVLSHPNLAVGKSVRREILFNQPLSADMLETPSLVVPGKIVRLVAEKGMLQITTLGQIREKGGAGDTVKVMNLGSKKIVYGCVIDAQTVRVEF